MASSSSISIIVTTLPVCGAEPKPQAHKKNFNCATKIINFVDHMHRGVGYETSATKGDYIIISQLDSSQFIKLF